MINTIKINADTLVTVICIEDSGIGRQCGNPFT